MVDAGKLFKLLGLGVVAGWILSAIQRSDEGY